MFLEGAARFWGMDQVHGMGLASENLSCYNFQWTS